MAGTLWVRVKSAYDAECAEQGGADRLVLTSFDALAPEPKLVASVRQASSVHLRVLLRLREGYTTDGGEMAKLKGLSFACADAGADGFVCGFLNAMSGIDQPACAELVGDATWPWTFDRAIDAVLNQQQAWATLAALPRLDSVMTAGSARQVEHGLDRLIALAGSPLPVVASGDLQPEHVPWLARAGLSNFLIDAPSTGAGGVRAWRRLIDAELGRR